VKSTTNEGQRYFLNESEIPMNEMLIDSQTVLDELLSDTFVMKLETLAQEKAEEYRNNKPFPSIYFDNLLPQEVAEAALKGFPTPKQLAWNEFDNPNEKKLEFRVVEKLPSAVRDVLYFLNSRPMLQFLEVLTGIQGLIPDPYYLGGGLHQIKRGGKLEIHADFNRHTKLKLDRRINVLIYLNPSWKEEYGGHFELWNRDMTNAEQKILPVFNRCAIFSTTSFSYHGHPLPLACPAGETRKSIATYYYSNGRPEEEVSEAHSTLFQHRPGDNKKQNRIKNALRAITPPILIDAIKKINK
jgi:Rps23 Pro-64 3,4-dihydroxylase Tpa1-like proline 4-hydroxylase